MDYHPGDILKITHSGQHFMILEVDREVYKVDYLQVNSQTWYGPTFIENRCELVQRNKQP